MKKRSYEDYSAGQGVGLHLFSDEQIEELHSATLRVLEHTGIFVESKKALDVFKNAGANVDFATNIVKFPPHLVEEAIRTSPQKILLAGRNPDQDIVLGDDTVHFTTFGEAVNLLDLTDGKQRPVTLQDVENYTKVVDACKNYSMCWDALVPNDVNPELYTLYSLEAYLNNTTKAVCVATPDGYCAKLAIEMGAAVAGGKDKLRERPLFTAGTCPQSPLFYHTGVCDAMMELAAAGIPLIFMSAATAGGTGPVTLAGTIVIHNAEMLTGLVLSQLVNQGAPYIYGSATTILDLRRGNATYGCPEIGMIGAALAQLTKYYKIPLITAGCWSDSKALDMQTGHEKTLNAVLPALAGASMVFGAGGIEGGLTFSFGQLVADDEFCGMIKRVMKGIPIDEEHLALDLIHAVGPRGNFLAESHTVQHMKESQSYPRLLHRGTREEWMNGGGKDYGTRCNEEAARIIREHQPEPLPAEVANKLKAILTAAEKELQKKP